MLTFEELTKANGSIVTMGIEKKNKKTGKIETKQYAEVPQRVKVFRMLCPNGGIETEIINLQDGVVIIKAVVKDEDGKVLGTGTAYEKENSTFINQTSYIENCETSAVGRALAMCGIGIDLSMASYEEVANAKLNQDKAEDSKETSKAVEMLTADRSEMLKVVEAHYPVGSDALGLLLKCWGIKSLNEATESQLRVVYNKYQGK